MMSKVLTIGRSAAGSLALLCLFAVGVVFAQQGKDDPFSTTNQAAAKGVEAKEQGKANQAEPNNPPSPVPHLELRASVTPQKAKAGEKVKLTIKGEVEPGFHTYPVTQHTPDFTESGLCKIEFEQDFTPLWDSFNESPAELETASDGTQQFVYNKEFTWSLDVLVPLGTKPGRKPLKMNVKGQVCDNVACTRFPNYPLQVDIEIAEGQAAVTTEVPKQLNAKGPAIKVVDPAAIGEAPASRGLLAFVLVSMGAAIAMLLTPCVFPMIPITVSFFLKQSEKKDHNALLTAAIYCGTIILVLAAAVLLLGRVILDLANSPWMNLGLGAMLVFFALSLFGMYEIELPSGLARFTAAHEGRGGYIGAIFMALTFTITSFTCTGPFLGPLLVTVKEVQLSTTERIVGALAYAGTFAAPFFVLALFPRLLKALPKSGGWLNAVKVVMGFLELAMALKFLANTDLFLNPGRPLFLNYETVLCSWVALSIACALYLLGLFRLPHDSPVESLSVPRMLLAGIFLGLAIYMVPALWRIVPQGVVGRGLVAFLPPDMRVEQTALTWSHDYEDAWKQAVKEDKLIFIDFTGINCTNCRYNEKNVFVLPRVQEELKKYVRVQLYTDSVPDPGLSSAEAEKQAERNGTWQGATFGDLSNPFYAIIRPTKDQPPFIEKEGKPALNGAIREWTRSGLIDERRLPDFERFLSDPLKRLAVQPRQEAAALAAGLPVR